MFVVWSICIEARNLKLFWEVKLLNKRQGRFPLALYWRHYLPEWIMMDPFKHLWFVTLPTHRKVNPWKYEILTDGSTGFVDLCSRMVDLCWGVSPMIILKHFETHSWEVLHLDMSQSFFGAQILVLDVLAMVHSPWPSDSEPCTAARRWHGAVCLRWRWKVIIFMETAIEVVVLHSGKQKENCPANLRACSWLVVVHENWNCTWWCKNHKKNQYEMIND